MLQGYVDKTFKLNTNVKTDFSIVASGPPSYAASQVTIIAEFPGVKIRNFFEFSGVKWRNLFCHSYLIQKSCLNTLVIL